MSIIRRIISINLIIAMLAPCAGWAGSDALAPSTRVRGEDFLSLYRQGYQILVDHGLRETISDYVRKALGATSDAEADLSGLPQYRLDTVIPIVGIPGLCKLLKEVDGSTEPVLMEWNGTPTIFVDSKRFNREDESLRRARADAAKLVLARQETTGDDLEAQEKALFAQVMKAFPNRPVIGIDVTKHFDFKHINDLCEYAAGRYILKLDFSNVLDMDEKERSQLFFVSVKLANIAMVIEKRLDAIFGFDFEKQLLNDEITLLTALKHAFFQMNRLDIALPLYLCVDTDKPSISIFAFDKKVDEDSPEWRRKEAAACLSGVHTFYVRLPAIEENGADYEITPVLGNGERAVVGQRITIRPNAQSLERRDRLDTRFLAERFVMDEPLPFLDGKRSKNYRHFFGNPSDEFSEALRFAGIKNGHQNSLADGLAAAFVNANNRCEFSLETAGPAQGQYIGYAEEKFGNGSEIDFKESGSILYVCDPAGAKISKLSTRSVANCLGVSMTARLEDGRIIYYLGHLFNVSEPGDPEKNNEALSDRIEETLEAIFRFLDWYGVRRKDVQAAVVGGIDHSGQQYAERAIRFIESKGAKVDSSFTGGIRLYCGLEVDTAGCSVSFLVRDKDDKFCRVKYPPQGSGVETITDAAELSPQRSILLKLKGVLEGIGLEYSRIYLFVIEALKYFDGNIVSRGLLNQVRALGDLGLGASGGEPDAVFRNKLVLWHPSDYFLKDAPAPAQIDANKKHRLMGGIQVPGPDKDTQEDLFFAAARAIDRGNSFIADARAALGRGDFAAACDLCKVAIGYDKEESGGLLYFRNRMSYETSGEADKLQDECIRAIHIAQRLLWKAEADRNASIPPTEALPDKSDQAPNHPPGSNPREIDRSQLIEKLERLQTVFSAYREILTDYGRHTQGQVERLLERPRGSLKEPLLLREAEDIAALMPEPDDIDVVKGGSKNWVNWFIEPSARSYQKYSIGDGCVHGCYQCYCCSPTEKASFDPAPVVIKRIMDGSLTGRASVGIEPYFRNDPFEWRDPFFGFYLDSIIKFLRSYSPKTKITLTTKGWDPKDTRMQAAAEHIAELLTSSDHDVVLSFHLFLQDIDLFSALKETGIRRVPDRLIDAYAEWYGNAIKTLKPCLDSIYLYIVPGNARGARMVNRAAALAMRRSLEVAGMPDGDIRRLMRWVENNGYKPGKKYKIAGVTVEIKRINPSGRGEKLYDMLELAVGRHSGRYSGELDPACVADYSYNLGSPKLRNYPRVEFYRDGRIVVPSMKTGEPSVYEHKPGEDGAMGHLSGPALYPRPEGPSGSGAALQIDAPTQAQIDANKKHRLMGGIEVPGEPPLHEGKGLLKDIAKAADRVSTPDGSETTDAELAATLDEASGKMLKCGESIRPKNKDARPGQLLLLKAKRLVVLGDLHNDEKALETIMSRIPEEELKTGDTQVVFLGDAVDLINENDYNNLVTVLGDGRHPVCGGHSEYKSGMARRGRGIYTKLANLASKYPAGFHMLLGNCDYGFRWAGGKQEEMRDALGAQLSGKISNFIEAAPSFAIAEAGGRRYLLSHSGYIKEGACREDLINFPRRPLGESFDNDENKTLYRSVSIIDRFNRLCESHGWKKDGPAEVNAAAEESSRGELSAMLNETRRCVDVSCQITGHVHLFGKKAEEAALSLKVANESGRRIAISEGFGGSLVILNSFSVFGDYAYFDSDRQDPSGAKSMDPVRVQKGGNLSHDDENYRAWLIAELEEHLGQRCTLNYIERVANAIVRYDNASIDGLAERSIISKEDAAAIKERSPFDVAGLAESVSIILMGYEEAGFTDIQRLKLISNFFTADEINGIHQEEEFGGVVYGDILSACINNPRGPRGFLRKALMTMRRMRGEEEFEGITDSIIFYFCINYPKDPRGALRRVLKTRDDIRGEEEFGGISDGDILIACMYKTGSKDPRNSLRKALKKMGDMQLEAEFRDVPKSYVMEVCVKDPDNARDLLRNALKAKSDIRQEPEFGAILESDILRVCLNSPDDPRSVLHKALDTAGTILSEEEFAKVRYDHILHVCITKPASPRDFLRSALKAAGEIRGEAEFKDEPDEGIMRACVHDPNDPRSGLRKMIARRRLSGPAVSPEDASAKNSPAEFLAAVKLDPDLMRTARLDEGFGPKDSAPLRLYPKRTLEILCGLGILTGPDESGRRYRFSEMMIGTPSADRDYTATMINAVSGMIYRIPGRGSRRLLERDNIKEDMWPAVKEACRMDMLEELDRMAKPAAPQGRILWHIIENGLAASSQAYSFRQAVNNMSFGSSAVERVYMMGETETIESAMARIKDACANAVFDIALSDVRHIENVPAYEGDDRIMMLVFEGEVGGFSHIKGIVSALRALRMPHDEAIPMLERIYLVLSGKRYDGKAPPAELLDNPPEFARQFIFTLPPASSIPQDEIRRLNSRLLELLRSA